MLKLKSLEESYKFSLGDEGEFIEIRPVPEEVSRKWNKKFTKTVPKKVRGRTEYESVTDEEGLFDAYVDYTIKDFAGFELDGEELTVNLENKKKIYQIQDIVDFIDSKLEEIKSDQCSSGLNEAERVKN